MTPTRRLWRKQSRARDAASEMFSMRALEPASARELFLTGVSTMEGPVRRRRAATSESIVTDQHATAESTAALKPWQQDRPLGGVAVRNSLDIRSRCLASWPTEMQKIGRASCRERV